MKLFLLLTPLIFLTSCMSNSGESDTTRTDTVVKNDYYTSLSDGCMNLDNGEKGGCTSSVKWMEKNGFREAENGACPSGSKLNMYKTRGSKLWCEPTNREPTSIAMPTPTNTGETTPDSPIIAPNPIAPEILQTLETYAGKSLNQEGWILLKNVLALTTYTESSNTYTIYAGNIEPKYCKPYDNNCWTKQFMVITENTVPIYYADTVSAKYACKGLADILPENISAQIIQSYCQP